MTQAQFIHDGYSIDHTPVANVAAGVAKTSLDSVIKGVWPFLLAQSILLFLFVLFPQLVMVPASWFR